MKVLSVEVVVTVRFDAQKALIYIESQHNPFPKVFAGQFRVSFSGWRYVRKTAAIQLGELLSRKREVVTEPALAIKDPTGIV